MKYTSKAMFRLLQTDGSISINKYLIHSMGLNESIIYCELLSRHSYFEDRGQLQEDGSFFNTIQDLELGTGLGEKAQRTAIKNLSKLGLLKTKVKGIPAKRYFYINFEIDLNELIDNGEQKIIKLKESLGKLVKSTVPPKEETSSDDRSILSLQEKILDTSQVGRNNTNSNNTKNNTNTNNQARGNKTFNNDSTEYMKYNGSLIDALENKSVEG